jgi:uncharacterized SAM-binding protein YcdF (DUF218 family)
MNDFLLWLGLDALRPTLAALLLPPVPFLVLVVLGARMFARYRVRAWLVVLLGCTGVWATCTYAAGYGLTQWLLPPTRSLAPSEIGELKRAPRTAIVVLGGGQRDLAPEYGVSELSPLGVERLRYGLWLSRQTELPVLFTGGRGHGATPGPGPSEAEIAARTAERDFGRPLKWTETESRDTRENALRSAQLLREQGIERIVVVTHGYHMPRALDNFRRAVAGSKMQIVAAPMGLITWSRPSVLDFLPTRAGYMQVSLVLHEFFGRLIGA